MLNFAPKFTASADGNATNAFVNSFLHCEGREREQANEWEKIPLSSKDALAKGNSWNGSNRLQSLLGWCTIFTGSTLVCT